MKADELLRIATSLDVDVQASATGLDIIRSIQLAEGNSPCYQSEIAPVCGLEDCLWRDQGCVSGSTPLA